jgi:non-heme chloroperoxidase
MTAKRIWCSLVLVAALSLLRAEAAEKKPWKDATVSVGDLKIHYIEMGAGDRSLVLIPGLTMAAEVWKEQLIYFSARNYRVIAYDPRSQGSTTKTDAGNTYQQHAADMHAFLGALKVEHATLVGWSAAVSTLLEYLASPEAMPPDKVVLVDGFPSGQKDQDYPGGFTAQQARGFMMPFQEDRGKATDKFVRGMFKSKQMELLYKEMTDASIKTPTGTMLALFFDLYTGDRRPLLARISVPTLVVVSPDSRLLGEYMQSKIPHSKLEVVPDAGHAVFLDKPQTFNQVLETFLDEP